MHAADAPLPPAISRWLPPSWWVPVQAVQGDLNANGLADLAIIVERPRFTTEDPAWPAGARGLLVLFAEAPGQYAESVFVPGLLPCADCLDSLNRGVESVVTELAIADDGALELGWLHRRDGTRAVRLFIAWDAREARLGLRADDVIRLDDARGQRTRTRRDFRTGQQWRDGVEQPISARFIPIEAVSADDY